MPAAVAVVILYFCVGLVVLVRADYRQWRASYTLSSAKMMQIISPAAREALRLKDAIDEYATQLKMDPAAQGDEADLATMKYKRILDRRTYAMEEFSRFASLSFPAGEMVKQARLQLIVFVAIPLGLAVAALLLLGHAIYVLV